MTTSPRLACKPIDSIAARHYLIVKVPPDTHLMFIGRITVAAIVYYS